MVGKICRDWASAEARNLSWLWSEKDDTVKEKSKMEEALSQGMRVTSKAGKGKDQIPPSHPQASKRNFTLIQGYLHGLLTYRTVRSLMGIILSS